jgi:hypothetical protein
MDIVFAKETESQNQPDWSYDLTYNVFSHCQFFNQIGDISASNFGQVVQAHDRS